MMKLYVYDHCPYCVKARMIFGLKKVPFKLITLLNDDEKTPFNMIGQKMVPILEVKKQDFMPESLDIISYIDKQNKPTTVLWTRDTQLSKWLDKNSDTCYQLAMPRWIKMPLKEFKSQKSRDYFQDKKEAYIGSFKHCLKNTAPLVKKMTQQLDILESFFEKNQAFFTGTLSVNDFHLFAFLRSLTVVKGLNLPKKIKYYSQKMAEQSQVPLHTDMAV